jgi:MoaA/NifB/PqqE/SkfB family radical SAM enzyme
VGERLLALKARYPRFVALRGYVRRFSRAIEDGGMGPCHTGKSLCNIDVRGEVSLCIERLAESVGNILTDDVFDLRKRLAVMHAGNSCRACWTSCRGSIESLKGAAFFTNMADYRRMTREVPLAKTPATAASATR